MLNQQPLCCTRYQVDGAGLQSQPDPEMNLVSITRLKGALASCFLSPGPQRHSFRRPGQWEKRCFYQHLYNKVTHCKCWGVAPTPHLGSLLNSARATVNSFAWHIDQHLLLDVRGCQSQLLKSSHLPAVIAHSNWHFLFFILSFSIANADSDWGLLTDGLMQRANDMHM